MPPRELPAEALDTESSRAGVLSAQTSGTVAEDDELAQAQARAEAARARARRLREQAEASDQGDRSEPDDPDSAPARRRWLHRPARTALSGAAAIVVSCASVAGSGYLVWQHHQVEKQRQRTADFAATARNAVVAMMSIDPNRARDDMQRFTDDTMGLFKAGILMGGEDAVKAVEQSKVSSNGSVQAVAVQSMTDDSAIVLVAAKAELTKPGQPKPDSRSLRLVVSVQRDAGQLKVSRIEFVP